MVGHWSDCAAGCHGVEEWYGPCDCGVHGPIRRFIWKFMHGFKIGGHWWFRNKDQDYRYSSAMILWRRVLFFLKLGGSLSKAQSVISKDEMSMMLQNTQSSRRDPLL